MVIDFHTHCFSEKIAARAIPTLEQRSGMRAFFDGTPAGLLALMDRHGIDAAVVANIATNPRQQRAVNEFAVSLLAHPRLIPFGSVHPGAPDAAQELRRLKEAGLKGVKLHPDYQEFYVDDPRVFPLYRTLAELGLVTLFHAGVDIGLPSPVHCTPERLARALPEFGGAPVVAAHFGGYLQWREVLEHLCGRDIYFDTSYCARKLPPAWARELLAAHPKERILFGTDLPWADPADELDFVRGFGPEAAPGILGGNAARLLGL
ncbi:MAG: amidohydrolase family protein [Oscillospiraceae bacterium]|jgi:predicted TIM-barrel fold metal-dependent hydrolase|nr:amidohydrolase family protein [Oscillospiraceae bacterium]